MVIGTSLVDAWRGPYHKATSATSAAGSGHGLGAAIPWSLIVCVRTPTGRSCCWTETAGPEALCPSAACMIQPCFPRWEPTFGTRLELTRRLPTLPGSQPSADSRVDSVRVHRHAWPSLTRSLTGRIHLILDAP